jgi:DNA-binding beta-propeller fold protein YncE
MRSTRRSLLGGALAAPLLLPRAAEAEPSTIVPVRQRTVRRGRAVAVSADGRRVVVAHDQRPTIALGREVVAVSGQPVAVAVSADGSRVAAVTASWEDEPKLVLVGGAHRPLGPAPRDLVFAGDRLVVVGGEQEGTLHVLDAASLRTAHRVAVGRVPRAVAVHGARAWVTLEADARVVAVDLRSGRVTRTLKTPALPDRLAVSPDGERLLVSHGGQTTKVTEIEIARGKRHRHEAGRQPSAVAWTRGGRRVVALGGEDAVVVLGRRPRRHAVAPGPRALAVAGRRFWTVSTLTGGTSRGRL